MSKTTRPRRRWLSFSLRTLFIVVTLICLALGLWITKSIRQRDAIAELRAISDRYRFGYAGDEQNLHLWNPSNPRPSPGLAQRLLGIDFVKPATHVWVDRSNGEWNLADTLPLLAKLPCLEKISFDGCDDDVTDKSLPALACVKRLRILEIYFYDSNSLTGVGFKSLATLPDLRELSLHDCDNLNDEGIDAICELHTLRKLSLHSCGEQFTNVGLAQLKRLRNLNSLKLPLLTERATDVVLAELQSLPELRYLNLDLSANLRRALGLKNLSEFPRLEELEVQMGLDDEREIADLPSLPHLKKLNCLLNSPGFSDAILHHFSRFPNVRHLELGSAGSLSEVGMADLVTRFPKIESLRLLGFDSVSQGVSDLQAVDNLARLSNLSDLALGFTLDMTDRNALAPFTRLPQLAKLDVCFGPAAVDLDMSHLTGCRKLTQLTISGANAISDAGLADIAKLTSLRKLTIRQCSAFSDVGLKQLAAMKNLKELTIIVSKNGQLSAAACDSLRAALPHCQFNCSTPSRIL